MSPNDIRPGRVLEWRYTPDWSVSSLIVVDRIENGSVWIHHEGTGTVNRLSFSALLRNARPADEVVPIRVVVGLAILAWALIGGLVWLWLR